MILLILIGIMITAIIYGAFFLLFKLIWVLCKKPHNFWPLVLAGITTLVLYIALVLSVYYTTKKWLSPFTPILEAVSSRSEPVFGEHTYTDPKYGFSITLYNGTVFSDWIPWEDNQLLLGIDTNILVDKKANPAASSSLPITLYAIVRSEFEEDIPLTAEEALTAIMSYSSQMDFDGEVVWDMSTVVSAGPNATVAQAEGLIYNSSYPQGIPFVYQNVIQGNVLYHIVGGSVPEQEEVYKTVNSFRLPGGTAIKPAAGVIPTQSMRPVLPPPLKQ